MIIHFWPINGLCLHRQGCRLHNPRGKGSPLLDMMEISVCLQRLQISFTSQEAKESFKQRSLFLWEGREGNLVLGVTSCSAQGNHTEGLEPGALASRPCSAFISFASGGSGAQQGLAWQCQGLNPVHGAAGAGDPIGKEAGSQVGG